jgi:hypothetical protein
LIRRRVLTGLLAINPRRPTKVGFRLTYVPSVLCLPDGQGGCHVILPENLERISVFGERVPW